MANRTHAHYVGFYTSEEMKAWIDQQAKKENRTVSNYLFHLFSSEMKKERERDLNRNIKKLPKRTK